MKNAIPQNDILLCKKTTGDEKKTSSGFIYKSDDLPEYLVISIGPKVKVFSPGDVVVASSDGTPTTIDGIDYVMFKEESIMGKAVV